MYRKQTPKRVINTQELRRSNAAGFHSSVKYSRDRKYPENYIEEDETPIFFWESEDLEETLD